MFFIIIIIHPSRNKKPVDAREFVSINKKERGNVSLLFQAEAK